MKFRGRLMRWERLSLLGAAMAFGWAAPAVAADAEATPERVTSPVLDPMAPSTLMAGPSLRETGRVGVMPGASPPAESLSPAALQWSGDREKSVQPVAAGFADAPPPRPPVGIVDPVRLKQELGANLAKVEHCRVEVARARRVPPAQLNPPPLVLRWTIEPNGETRPRDVVSTGPADQDVMTCARSAMSQWQFTPPRGGSVEVEQTVSFGRR